MGDVDRGPYQGREQAKVKHMLLQRYIVRLFMIMGQREPVINYVDCFAGPWQSESDDLSDTSIGIARSEMLKCYEGLTARFNQRFKFRALFIEKDPKAFERLRGYVNNNTSEAVELHCLKGEFLDLVPQIARWSGGNFTFFFVDPKGWLDVSAQKMAPLLSLPRSEFLINFMYDFANRSIAQPDKFEHHVKELLGYVPDLSLLNPQERKLEIVNLYRAQLKTVFGEEAFSSFLPVERPGQNRTLYYMVYLSRHSSGIDAFKSEAEKTDSFQNEMQVKAKIQKLADRSNMGDLFGDDGVDQASGSASRRDLIAHARQSVLSLLAERPVKVDMGVWARLLETNVCLPSDFQAAIKELTGEGLIQNMSADIGRRSAKPLAPKKMEVWKIIE